ncbi:MAG: efflux RND transporter permease subunit, partial [Candidatus Omnitrophota bacterium]
RSFGLTIIYATIFSLLASFALTPMLCAAMLKPKSAKKPLPSKRTAFFNTLFAPLNWVRKGIDMAMEFLRREYKHIFDLIFQYPKMTIAAVAAVFFASLLLVPYVENDFSPKYDMDKFTINMNMPQGSTIDRTLEACKIIEAYLDKIPEKKSYLTNIGDNGVENALITVDLVPLSDRKRSDVAIIDELTKFTATIPDVEVSFARGHTLEAGTGDISIDLHGIDYGKMIEISRQMKDVMQKSGYFNSVHLSYKDPKDEIRMKPLQEKLIEYGVTASAVGSSFRSSVYGEDSNTYKEKGEEYKINIELNDIYAQDFDDIRVMSVLSRKGLIPLAELGKLTIEKSLPMIRHRDRVRVIQIDGFLGKSSMGVVQGIMDKQFRQIQFPEGYGYRYVGMSEIMDDTNREMAKAFMLAVILTFMLLCALMNSLIAYPASVMTTVFTSVSGMIAGLFFFGSSINVASMLGVVMLVGMVVNNAILFLDYTLVKMKEGVEVKEALWLGVSEKFRAIMMTSIAIILGVLPQVWAISDVKVSLGAVMTGGMLASILFTFILVPVVFWYLDRLERKLFKR